VSSYLLRKGSASEDAYTGMLADLMTWWPEDVLSLLQRTRRFESGRVDVPSGLPRDHHVGELRVHAWPRWSSGEPDLVLEFTREEGARSLVIIEAKLGAPKSSIGDAAADEAEGRPSRDQLAKYRYVAARGEERPSAPRPSRVDVVYLTHHPAPPIDDLQASFDVMSREVVQGVVTNLYWLGWSDIELSLREELKRESGARARALLSVASVLQQAGYQCFTGSWRAEAPEPPHEPMPWRFFRSWRLALTLPPLGGRIFWRERDR
jgi:hypothetical protein